MKCYASKGESDEVYSAQLEAVVRNLAHYYRISEAEAMEKLKKSDINNPVSYYDGYNTR